VSAWYLLQCKSRQEKRAELNLTNQNWRCYCPMAWVNKSKTMIPQKVYEPLFPGYLFIELEEDVGNWGTIRSTRGVLGFVRFGQYPIPISQDIVQNLMHTLPLIEIGLTADVSFHAGESVRITGGCFEGLNAIYQCESGKERAIILLNIVGSNTAVQVDKTAIEKF